MRTNARYLLPLLLLTTESRAADAGASASLLEVHPIEYPAQAYNLHAAQYVSCHDGDTCTLIVTLEDTDTDLGLGLRRISKTTLRASARLCGLDAPELATAQGPPVARQLNAWLQGARQVQVTMHGYDKYGRLLVRVYADGADLNKRLLDMHLAVPYMECSGG